MRDFLTRCRDYYRVGFTQNVGIVILLKSEHESLLFAKIILGDSDLVF